YSGMETGVISIRRLRLRHRLQQGDRAAKRLAFFLEDPGRLLGTTLVGTNLCIVIASVVSARLSTYLIGPGGQVLSGLLVSVCLLVFGEYVPKAWFRAFPYYRSARFAEALYYSWVVFSPVGAAVTWIAGLFVKEHESGQRDLCSLANRDELKILTVEAEQNGVLTAEERAMIHQTVELADKTAGDIQKPLSQAVVVESGCSIDAFVDVARSNSFSRYPVRQPGTPEFAGIVDLFDVLTRNSTGSGTITPFIRPAVMIPHDVPAEDVMPRLRIARQSMGLVADEKGEVTGLVTTSDILNQIVV
ncbi:MAG: DUF21 domain-containing protein, partial [Pontiella sp.]|nr:DUF21 domain-containing protein [Pontiella sp.]